MSVMSDVKHTPSSSIGTNIELEPTHKDEPESQEELAHLEKTTWRKLDRWILPIATMFYLLSFLDRSNIANAKVAGMQKSLKMTNTQYSMALTVTYIPYIVAELPSNLLLRAVGPDLMLPSMVTLWGLVTTMQVLYLSFFYPRSRLNVRVSTFFASASLSGAFSGLLAAAIMNMNGMAGKAGWAWIFILEGIFTFLFGALSFFILPRSVAHARFLQPHEKKYITARLREDGVMSAEDSGDDFSWAEVGRAFLLPQVWFMVIPFFFCGTTLYGLAYFEPAIVQTMGFTAVRTQLMSVPPFAAAFVVNMIAAWISDKYNARGFTSIFASFLCLIGFSMFLGSSHNSVRYGSLFFSVSGTYLSAPAMSTWNANNAAPQTRRATAIAIAFIMTNSGGILATWLLGSLSPAPAYHSATVTFVIMSVLMALFSGVNLWWLWKENKRKAEVRKTKKREDEKYGLGDRSAWFVYNL
ncbi:hypothetical protein PLICRDRAFT_54249 [Plicaturopsis crispa FD-325 SS-3]|nr:hypothetical protein PLICRDRAFT_54249 [Plicaturopsis crispa FD-325 SS-3]